MYQKLPQKFLKKVERWIGKKLNVTSTYRIVIKPRARAHRAIKFTEEKRLARAHFEKRLTAIALAQGISYNRLRISSAKTRWGSCSRKRNINLNWRLIFAPEQVLDYVIVHELSHLTHMNHSKAFWSHVESMMPDYKTHRAWLKHSAHALSRTGRPLAPNAVAALHINTAL